MTTYEKFKAGVLVCLGIFLVSISVAVARTSSSWAATPGKVNVVLDSFAGVGPQAVVTLRTLQDTTTSVGKQATTSLKVTGKVGKVLDGVTQTLDGVNRLCNVPGKPCGTLADFNRTLATVRGTFGQIEVAARHENSNLDALDVQEKRLADDVHTTTVNLNTLVASPDITRFLKASADTSIQVAAIATEGTAIAKDIHKEADALTAPTPWYHKVGSYAKTSVNVACLVTHSCPF